tara:strand:- start:1117 stop:1242 length:126 start_codon:yes stop_codon:yes gene_type:complete
MNKYTIMGLNRAGNWVNLAKCGLCSGIAGKGKKNIKINDHY